MRKSRGIIPKDTRYVPLTQQSYCCVPVCIQMIMLRNNIPLVPAELMAHYLHILVPKESKKDFWNVRTGHKPPMGYGTQLNEDLSADFMFKKLDIPLRMEWSLINQFTTYKDFKKHILLYNKKNRDVLVCFNAKALVPNWIDNGHVCVLDKVFPRKETVRIIDSSPRQPKWRTISIKKMYKAMQVHGADNMAGFWEFKKI